MCANRSVVFHVRTIATVVPGCVYVFVTSWATIQQKIIHTCCLPGLLIKSVDACIPLTIAMLFEHLNKLLTHIIGTFCPSLQEADIVQEPFFFGQACHSNPLSTLLPTRCKASFTKLTSHTPWVRFKQLLQLTSLTPRVLKALKLPGFYKIF